MYIRLIHTIFVLLIITVNTSAAKAADIYLVRSHKDKKTYIVFTADKAYPFDVKKIRKGVYEVFIKGLIPERSTKTTLKDKILRAIDIIKRKNGTSIVVYLNEGYKIAVVKEKPFKLKIYPKKITPKGQLLSLIEKNLKEDNCHNVIYYIKNLDTKELTIKELIFVETAKLKCYEELHDYKKAFMAASYLIKLLKDKNKIKKLKLKKIKLLYKAGEFEEAIAEAKLYMDKYTDTSSHLAFVYMVNSLINLGRIETAIRLIKNFLKVNKDTPYMPEIETALAKAFYLKNNFLAAFLLLDKAYQEKRQVVESDPEALFAYGNSAYKINQIDTALKILLRTFNLFPTSKQAAKALAVIGEIYMFKKKDWNTAAWFFKYCIRMFPETEAAAVARIRIGEYYELKNNLKKAYDEYTNVVLLYPHYKQALEVAMFKRGKILLKMKRYQEAIDNFKEFIMKFPSSRYLNEVKAFIQKAEFLIAKDLYTKKRYEDALKKLVEFAKKYPRNPYSKEAVKLATDALIKIIEDKYTRKECWGIITFWDTYRKFLPIEKKYLIPIFHVAECLFEVKRVKESVNLLEWIYDNEPKFKYKNKLLTYLKDGYLIEKNYNKAIKIMEEMIDLFKASEIEDVFVKLLKYYFGTGNVEFMDRLQEKAEKEKNIKLLSLVHFYKGIDLIEKKEIEAAKENLRIFLNSRISILEFPEKWKYAKIMMGRLYYITKEPEKAYKTYLEFFNIFPDSELSSEALFMMGLINGAKREDFWKICLSKFPKSYWSREIIARTTLDKIREIIESGRD